MTDIQPEGRLAELGWTAAIAADFAPHAAPHIVPARVAVEHRAAYELYTGKGEASASLSGRMRHEAKGRLQLPSVGDWVAFAPEGNGGKGTIEALLPRRSAFVRKAAGKEHAIQIVAANVDVVFLVTSLNAELSLRRLERYLTLAWESGASPVVILSKSDRAGEHAELLREIETVAAGVPVHVTSAKTGHGIDLLRAHLLPNKTGALLGSSGVGKSTLINALLGYERQATGEIRENDDKGRHTTTRRELVLLPGGGILIDTPGMRELQITDAGEGLIATFDDVEALAAECGFGDCTHGPEPDCAVKAAIAAGRLDRSRLDSYHKLVREVRHRTEWENKRAGAEAKKKDAAAAKALRSRVRDKRGER
jgi:ribosome biogenesis GTPase